MQSLKNLWKNEPVLVAGALGVILTFLLENWPVVHDFLLTRGLSENWLALILAVITFVVQRSQVKPVGKA